jgi:hypothetical protein
MTSLSSIVKTVTNEASLNPQMTQIGADEKKPLTWVTEVPDSVIINFDVSALHDGV